MNNKELDIFEFVETKDEQTEKYKHEEILQTACDLVNLYAHNAEFKYILSQRKNDIEKLRKEFKEAYGHLDNTDSERVLALQMLSRLGIEIFEPEREAEILKRKEQEKINQRHLRLQIQESLDEKE